MQEAYQTGPKCTQSTPISPSWSPQSTQNLGRERGREGRPPPAMAQLQELKEIWGLLRGKEFPAILELDESLRAKGDMTKEERVTLQALKAMPRVGFLVSSTITGLLGWRILNQGAKFLGAKPLPGIVRFGVNFYVASFTGKVMYYSLLNMEPEYILKRGEERMKMELANIILTKHSNEKTLVEAVRRHFFAEHLFSDQHQDKPLFRWHLRHSYTDGAFVERVKEIQANSGNEARSISVQTTTNSRSFGDLMEDPLACILGSPDSNMESDTPPEHTGNILRRRDLRAHRRRRRHHHQNADKFVAL